MLNEQFTPIVTYGESLLNDDERILDLDETLFDDGETLFDDGKSNSFTSTKTYELHINDRHNYNTLNGDLSMCVCIIFCIIVICFIIGLLVYHDVYNKSFF